MICDTSRPKRTAIRIAYAAVGAVCAMLPWISPADEGITGKPVFTDSEIKIILSHGPWPAPAADRMVPFRDFTSFLGLVEIRGLEQRFAGRGDPSGMPSDAQERRR